MTLQDVDLWCWDWISNIEEKDYLSVVGDDQKSTHQRLHEQYKEWCKNRHQIPSVFTPFGTKFKAFFHLAPRVRRINHLTVRTWGLLPYDAMNNNARQTLGLSRIDDCNVDDEE